MNKLFSIPLMGQGTAEVESLSSYVFRMAYEHGVSVGVLLSGIYQASGEDCRARHFHVAGKKGIEVLSRVNGCSKGLRQVLESLTGQDLFCWPIRFLEKQVYQISTEIGGFRWCPECFAEMSQVDSPRYIKQIWHMNAVIHCPLHRTPLVGVCPKCGQAQTSMRVQTHIGWCGQCGQSLAERAQPLVVSDIQPSWACMSHDLLEIFTKAAREADNSCSFRASSFFIGDLLAEFTENMTGDSSIDKDLKLMMAEYTRNRGMSWRLITLRRLAYLLNISLYDMLSANYHAVRLPYKPARLAELPEQIQPRKKVARNHKQEYQKLVTLLEQQAIPPSLKQLARRANVSVGYLEYRFPSLVRTVVESYQDYQKQQQLVRRYQAQAAALQYFVDDPSHSRKEAYRVLKDETGLPKWVLKNAIQTAYGVLQVGG